MTISESTLSLLLAPCMARQLAQLQAWGLVGLLRLLGVASGCLRLLLLQIGRTYTDGGRVLRTDCEPINYGTPNCGYIGAPPRLG